MKYLKITMIGLLFCFTILPTAFAATVEINWIEPDKYRDIDSGNSNKKRFHKRVFETLEKQFKDQVTKLPEDYKMKISVTDVDLAGDVRFATGDGIRLIKKIYFPRMHLTYELLDKEQKSLAAAEIKINDMGFLQSIRSVSRKNVFLYYERKMIGDWFNKTFAEYLVQK
ncbi:MAG: DUF3016 domain-containing protein [Gammaproteobacteria bacterium]|nr:DUF3016 domain-containing protein [Gammaproteobacteria bacterium]